jgi:hypothetical protein
MIPNFKTKQFIDRFDIEDYLIENNIQKDDVKSFFDTFEWKGGDSDYWSNYDADNYIKTFPEIVKLLNEIGSYFEINFKF